MCVYVSVYIRASACICGCGAAMQYFPYTFSVCTRQLNNYVASVAFLLRVCDCNLDIRSATKYIFVIKF